ncbi:MAG: hypothetical protein AB7D06_00780 [Pedobacter sp.]
MSQRFDLIGNCEFFREYCLGSEEIKAEWGRLFCGSMSTAALCERKKYRLTMEENPPLNMAPTGRLL